MTAGDEALRALLFSQGAALVGFADLRHVPGAPLPYGVSVAVPLPRDIVRSIQNGPNWAYFETYNRLNTLLDSLVKVGFEYLSARGFQALAQTRATVAGNDRYVAAMPHKTVATRAGLGWIGKCALLVTRSYGLALRLSSLLTDAPLACGRPVEHSRCGGCIACLVKCPGRAVTGADWKVGTPKEALYDPIKCARTARALSKANFGKEVALCGQCIVACPYTQNYLSQGGPHEPNQIDAGQ